MDQTELMHQGHEVFGEDYCSGYLDSFGKWNNGFPCPPQDSGISVHCCGTESVRYCCVRPKTPVTPPVSQMTLLLSITFAIAVTLMVIIIVSCFHCACCLLYKKRQPTHATNSVYQMQCPSNASGVANMYSISGMTTPAETPRSVSRTSSARSRLTTDSLDIADLHNARESGRSFLSPHSDSRPSSIAYSDRTSSTVSEGTIREAVPFFNRNRFGGPLRLPYHPFEPPPPYSAQNSTLVAVRTSSQVPSQVSDAPVSRTINGSFSTSDALGVGTQLRTFTQQPQTFSGLLGPPTQPQSLGVAARLSAMRLNQQLNSLANLRQGFANHTITIEDLLQDDDDSASSSGRDIPQPMNLITPSVFSTREVTSAPQIIVGNHSQRFDENRLYTATKF